MAFIFLFPFGGPTRATLPPAAESVYAQIQEILQERPRRGFWESIRTLGDRSPTVLDNAVAQLKLGLPEAAAAALKVGLASREHMDQLDWIANAHDKLRRMVSDLQAAN